MKKTILAAMSCLLLSAATCVLSSCSEEDGDWEEMKWNTSVKAGKGGIISVGSEGGTFEFNCTNYSTPWLCDVVQSEEGKADETFYCEEAPEGYADQYRSIQSTWLSAQFSGSKLTVKISPATGQKERTMKVNVTAGDIFDRFAFRQEGLSADKQ